MPLRTGANTTNARRIWVRAYCHPFFSLQIWWVSKVLLNWPRQTRPMGLKKPQRPNSLREARKALEEVFRKSWRPPRPCLGSSIVLTWIGSNSLRSREDLIGTVAAPYVPIPAMPCWARSSLLERQVHRWGPSESAQKTRIHRQTQTRGKPDSVGHPACVQSPNHRLDQASENSEPLLMCQSGKEAERYVSSVQFACISQSYGWTHWPNIELRCSMALYRNSWWKPERIIGSYFH